MLRSVTLTLLLFAATDTLLRAEDADALRRDPAENAALVYFKALRRVPDIRREKNLVWNEALTTPLTYPVDNVTDLIGTMQNCLKNVEAGTRKPYCDFGLERGPETLMEHLGDSRTLLNALLLRVRWRFEHGEPESAVDDLRTILLYMRHLAEDRFVISQLVRYRHEDDVAQVAAHYLPSLKPDVLHRLANHLDTLPPGIPLSEVLKQEKQDFLGWLRTILDRDGVESATAALLRTFSPKNADAREPFDKAVLIVEDGGKERLLALIDEIGKLYDEAVILSALHPDQFAERHAEFVKRLKAEHPIANQFFGLSLHGERAARLRELKAIEQLAMLRAAIAFRLDGEQGLKQFPDPFGDGPFPHVPRAEGFQLTSALTLDGKPFSMIFGEGAIAPENEGRLVFDRKADAGADFSAALVAAKDSGKRVLVMFGSNVEGSCDRMYRLLTEDPQVSPVVQKDYILVLVHIGYHDHNMRLALEHVPNLLDGSPPFLSVIDRDGVLIEGRNCVGFRSRDDRVFDPGKVREFLTKQAAAPNSPK